MNVFWLDDDPRLAARYHCDRHVSKMLLEAAQLCCTAVQSWDYGAEFLYRPTHADHPCTTWACASRANWERLREHARALNAEFRERFGHETDHASWTVIDRIVLDDVAFPAEEPTPRPQAMAPTYRREGDTVGAYRTYYATEKATASWAEWRYTDEPPWLEEYRLERE